MIGLFGHFSLSSKASQPLEPMLSTIPKELVCEKFKLPGVSFGRAAHKLDYGGSISNDNEIYVIVAGEIFNFDDFRHISKKYENSAELIRKLVSTKQLHKLDLVNGQYCAAVVDSKAHKLLLITDRLATFPIHYYQGSNEIIFSTQIFTLVSVSSVPRRPDHEALSQLFTMQRTVGSTTPIAGVKSLSAASYLEIDIRGSNKKKYWNLEWNKPDFTLSEGAEHLADSFKNAVSCQVKSSDSGLLLSGGLDSRIVLASAQPGTMTTWTTASYSENPELILARKVACLFNSAHNTLVIDPRETLEITDKTVKESCGLYPASTPMSAFLPKVGRGCSLILSGHGIDYTLRGYYLPTKFVEIGNSRTRLPTLKRIPTNPSGADVLYNLRQGPPISDVKRIIRDNYEEEWWVGLEDCLDTTLKPWLSSDEPYNAWDGFILHSVSKHYAFTGMMSVRAVGDLYLPAFDNNVLDIYLRMPPAWRVNGRMVQLALRHLSLPAFNLANANTGFSAGLSPWAEVGALFFRAGLRKIRVVQRPRVPSSLHSTGSWQNLAALYREEPKHRSRFLEIRDRLDWLAFDILDQDSLSDCIDEHLNGESDHTKLLRQLLTHDAWARVYNIDTSSTGS
mgnify:CR=1 FL=1|tara:strand:- start:11865 stop:13727 length:1863 start_codon:yes stop_codon:yes gene_type:complete